MKKRFLILPVGLAMLMLAGCTSQTTEPTTSEAQSFESEAATIAPTESESVETESSEAEAEEYISTGVLINFTDEAIDSVGNKDAVFQDAKGNEFVAIISEDTIMPEDFTVGNTYDVTHSQIQTMSIPPQYPEVSEIVLSDEVIEIMEGTVAEPVEAPSENVETSESTEEIVEIDELTEEERSSLEATE